MNLFARNSMPPFLFASHSPRSTCFFHVGFFFQRDSREWKQVCIRAMIEYSSLWNWNIVNAISLSIWMLQPLGYIVHASCSYAFEPTEHNILSTSSASSSWKSISEYLRHSVFVFKLARHACAVCTSSCASRAIKLKCIWINSTVMYLCVHTHSVYTCSRSDIGEFWCDLSCMNISFSHSIRSSARARRNYA